MQDFRELKVWQKAHQLSLAVYRESGRFPAEERFVLVSQVRRAAVSIESNIAEGRGLGSDAGFRKHLRIAYGSAFEVECQLLQAQDLGYLQNADVVFGQLAEVRRMLSALIETMKGDME